MSEKQVLVGTDLRVYLDADGMLVLSTEPKEGMRELTQTSDIQLNAPLHDIITANVKICVSQIDVSLLPPNARFVVNDAEMSHCEMIELERRCKSLQKESQPQ